MKKRFTTIILLFILCLTVGCTSTSKTNEDVSVEDEVIEEDVSDEVIEEEKLVSEPLSESSIIAMSNAMNENMTVEAGSWVYGVSWDDNGQGVLAKIKTDGTELTRLSKKWPSNIIILEGNIYYIAYDYDKEQATINSIRISGENEKTLIESSKEGGLLQCFLIYDDRIYYTENIEPENGKITGALYSTDLSGEDKKTVIDKAVYYPYIIDDKIFYQDDNDRSRIHVCNLDGTNDMTLIDEWVYQFITDGEYIYYTTYKEEPVLDENGRVKEAGNTIIKKCLIDGTNSEKLLSTVDVDRFAMSASKIYYVDRNDNYRLYTYELETKETDLISQNDYINFVNLSESCLYFFDYTEKYEYIEDVIISRMDGTYQGSVFEE